MLRIWHTTRLVLINGLLMLVLAMLLGRSQVLLSDKVDRIRAFTRWIEFDYVDWMLDALLMKNAQAALNAPQYLSIAEQRRVMYRYLDLVRKIDQLNYEVTVIYADPDVADPEQASQAQRAELRDARAQEALLAPLAEAVLQAQTSVVLKDLALTTGGQPLPPVLYRVTPLPYALIVSPRDRIEQEANLSLLPGMSLEERVAIENQVARSLDRSTLVVAIGGVGVYPTMVQSTTDLNWLAEVVAHEWTHNYLTLRPLGFNYDASPELRTINETTANIAGKEIGRALVARFYTERLPPPQPEESSQAPPEEDAEEEAVEEPPSEPVFDFRREMRETRVTAESLLAQGKIVEAEAYMEARRQVFWDNGYLIRKLNQAYFAFYGAYNDSPGGGAAGEDPVGPAVQALRERSASLSDFLDTIAGVTSFADLQALLQ
jgi:hypothetical protein